MNQPLLPGIRGEKETTVKAKHLATAYGSGTLEVFSTPAMIGLMEQTAMESVAPFLQENESSVGSEVNIRHLKATLPGEKVIFRSELKAVEGRKLVFEVKAHDRNGLIGEGIHTRYIVDKQRFIKNLVK